MKEAKKYEGRKILVKIETGDEKTNYEEIRNIVVSLDSFKSNLDNEMYTSIELLEDNLTLYKCDVKQTSNLAKLYEIRKWWNEGHFDYDKFLTKKEIIELLKNDALVAVNGLQEIFEKDLDKLED